MKKGDFIMAISVREYLDDNTKLELVYIPYGRKIDLVNLILENVIDRETKPATIDTALLKNVATQMFIQNATNINLSEDINDGENGYDVLCYNDALSGLLNSVITEFSVFQEILNDKVNDFYRYEYSSAKALYDIESDIANILSDSANYLEDKLKNLDVEQLVNMMSRG